MIRHNSGHIAITNNFRKKFLETSHFILTSYYRINAAGEPLIIYIEGDGLAWQTKKLLSYDPTPRNCLVLQLAAIDPSANVIYLTRPGQFCEKKRPTCDSTHWSDSRFSTVVVESMSEAIDSFLNLSKSKKVHFVGYSGGAAIAVLIAAKREDI